MCVRRAALNDMITNFGNGNPALANLPRKINLGLSPSRDDFPHTHINDVGLVACKDPETGEVRSRAPCLRCALEPTRSVAPCFPCAFSPASALLMVMRKSASAGCRWQL